METISSERLSKLADTGKIVSARIVGGENGYHLTVRTIPGAHILLAGDSGARRFSTLKEARDYLRGMGIPYSSGPLTDGPVFSEEDGSAYDVFVLASIATARQDRRLPVAHTDVMAAAGSMTDPGKEVRHA